MSETILEEAQRLVHGDRGAAYGHPYDDYLCTAAFWRAAIQRRYGIDVPLTPDFCCLLMSLMKVSREAGKPKRDSRVDGAGYLECADMCLEERDRRAALSLLAAKPSPGMVVPIPGIPPTIPAMPELDE